MRAADADLPGDRKPEVELAGSLVHIVNAVIANVLERGAERVLDGEAAAADQHALEVLVRDLDQRQPLVHPRPGRKDLTAVGHHRVTEGVGHRELGRCLRLAELVGSLARLASRSLPSAGSMSWPELSVTTIW